MDINPNRFAAFVYLAQEFFGNKRFSLSLSGIIIHMSNADAATQALM